MPPAARLRDAHRCPDHGGGPVDSGAGSVFIGMQRAAREGDTLACGPSTDRIAKGASNVIIDGLPAARLGDPTDHGGVVASGCFSVLIGTMDQSLALLRAAASEAPFCEECERAKRLARQEALAEEAAAGAPAPAEEDMPAEEEAPDESDDLDMEAEEDDFAESPPPPAPAPMALPRKTDRAIGRALLTVVSGRDAFRKSVLSPGDVLRVGRVEGDLILPHEAALARSHFELRWDGFQGELVELARRGGTWLDGVRVVQASVRHGSFIQAGSTLFSFHHEAFTPPRVLPRTAAETKLVAQALATLSAETGLYGVLDAARDDRVLVLLREAEDEHSSLYEGLKGRALDDVAPYLVRFVPGSRLLRALVEEGWGRGWGMYLTTDRPAKDVRRHLRRFLIVEEDTTRQRLYFRYYDPRILRDFWPLATPRQKDDLLGDTSCLLFEDANLGLVRVGRGEAGRGG